MTLDPMSLAVQAPRLNEFTAHNSRMLGELDISVFDDLYAVTPRISKLDSSTRQKLHSRALELLAVPFPSRRRPGQNGDYRRLAPALTQRAQ